MADKKETVARKRYSPEQLVEAVLDVRRKKCSISEASRIHGVPRTTISDHIKGKVTDFPKPGIASMLSEDEETALVDYIMYMSSRNMPLRRQDIRATIVELIRRSGTERLLSCKFNLAKGPSDGWFVKFEQRHPKLKWCVPGTLDGACDSQSNEYVLDHFFNTYEQLLGRLNLLDKPGQIYNCEESRIQPHVTMQKACGVKGETMGNHDDITVMMAVSAAGSVLPTFCVFNESFPTVSKQDNLPKSWHFATSPKGYIDKELFQKWFKDLFLPNCGAERPVLLLLDNHDSHISFDVINCAKQNQVEFLGFPSHATNILQPLDVGIFGCLKRKYNKICVAARLLSSKAVVTNSSFVGAWQTCISQAASPKVVQRAFRRTGIYPFDPCAIHQCKTKHVKVDTYIDGQPTGIVPVSGQMKSTCSHVANINAAIGPIQPESEKCKYCNMYPHPVASVRKLPPEVHAAFALPAEGSTASKKRCIDVPLEDKLRKTDQVVLSDSDDSDIDLVDNNCKICENPIPTCKGRGSAMGKRKEIDWVSCDICNEWFHCVCLKVEVCDLPDNYYCNNCINFLCI